MPLNNVDKKFVIPFALLDIIVNTLLELPAKASRITLNRIEKEVVALEEPAAPVVVDKVGLTE